MEEGSSPHKVVNKQFSKKQNRDAVKNSLSGPTLIDSLILIRPRELTDEGMKEMLEIPAAPSIAKDDEVPSFRVELVGALFDEKKPLEWNWLTPTTSLRQITSLTLNNCEWGPLGLKCLMDALKPQYLPITLYLSHNTHNA